MKAIGVQTTLGTVNFHFWVTNTFKLNKNLIHNYKSVITIKLPFHYLWQAKDQKSFIFNAE